jgi:flagellar hook-length control protein FliK
MPGAAYFSEAVETAVTPPGGAGPAVAAPAAPKAAAGNKSSPSDTPGFAQVLRRGLAKPAEKKNQEECPVDPSLPGAGVALPAPAAALIAPDLAAALAALLGAGQAPVVVADVAIAALPTDEAVPRAGGEKEQAVKADAGKTVVLCPPTPSVHPEAQAPAIQVEPPATAPAPPDPEAGSAVNETKAAPGPEEKLKLDFSVFDAAFPDGWQALFTPEQNSGAAEKIVQAAGKTNGALVDTLPMAAVSSAGAEARTATGSEKFESAGGAQKQLALDLHALALATVAKNQSAAAPTVNPAQAVPRVRPEKNLEPTVARADLRRESAPESLNGLAGGRPAASAAATSAPTPGQVLSRLTELQRQLTVEKLSQSVLPALQGGRETLTLDLNPPELGRVQVHVEKAANGSVNAVLTMQDRSVGEFFQGQIETIRKTLEDAGLQVGGLSVEIRQQFHQEAGEKTVPGAGKLQARASEQTGRHAADVRKTAATWGGGGASRVEIMV